MLAKALVHKDARLVGLLRGLKLLPQVLVLELVVIAELEDGKADGGLSEDEHIDRCDPD